MTASKRDREAVNFVSVWGGKVTKTWTAARFLKYEAYLEPQNFFLLPGIMEEDVPLISHVPATTSTQCGNIKSLRTPKLRCKNPATHGAYCGIHYKTPRPWVPGTPKLGKKKKKVMETHEAAVKRIIHWWRIVRGYYLYTKRGPAYYDRACPVNETDFFSTDKIADISGAYFFSYRSSDNHVYAFDIRSINSLLENAERSAHVAENPYNRDPISITVKQKVFSIVKLLKNHKCVTSWAPLTPATPEQQFRMKVVDVFHIIDELNYYSSPDWFLDLDARNHRKFYFELHDIWVHRAGLSLSQKTLIVPQFQTRLFRQAPWTLRDVPLEGLQKLNLTTIRLLITSAADRNDKILGAMYIVTALTLVSPGARAAYPWLFESVDAGPIFQPVLHNPDMAWLNNLLAAMPPLPPLQLPPPAQ